MIERLWPAESLFLASVHEDIVMLDIEADQYSGLLDVRHLMELQSNGSVLVSESDVAAELLETGLFQTRSPLKARKSPQPVLGELAKGPDQSPCLTIGLMAEVIEASMAFQTRTLSGLIESVTSWPSPINDDEDQRLARTVSAFRSALPYVPFEGECLQRSFQLKRILDRRGLKTDWVFGVRTWPFGAHCWIQKGNQVVGDRLERVRLYTPIMVI